MSARVFKPILLGEMPKMRTSPTLDAKLATRGIVKVRRALFNAVSSDSEENNRRFVDEELAKIAANQAERWNFDFLSGRPIVDASAPYAWMPLLGSSSVLMPQRPIKMTPASPDISDLYPPIVSTAASLNALAAKPPDEKMSTTPVKNDTPKKQQLQSKITDFLSVRKRAEASPSTSKKFHRSTSRPRKIPRLATS